MNARSQSDFYFIILPSDLLELHDDLEMIAMNKQPKIKAVIHWLPEEERGRNAIPLTPKLVAPASIEGPLGSVDASWSLVIKMLEPPATDRSHKVTIHFLVPEAPHHLLVEDAEFIMFEGPHVFLKGKVVD